MMGCTQARALAAQSQHSSDRLMKVSAVLQKRVVTPACWRLYDGTWQLLYILQKGAESAAVLSPAPVTSGPPPHPQLQRKDSLVGQAHFLMDTKSSGVDAPEAIIDTSEQLPR